MAASALPEPGSSHIRMSPLGACSYHAVQPPSTPTGTSAHSIAEHAAGCADGDTTDGRAIPSTDLQADGGANGATIAEPDGDTDGKAEPAADVGANRPDAHSDSLTDVVADVRTDGVSRQA